MASEDVKKLLIIVSSFLLVFLVFFFLFWRPMFSDLRKSQEELSKKEAELARLEQDARDWPASITRERLDGYEMELQRLLNLIPSEEEIAMLLDEIQTHARVADLEILALSRISARGNQRTSAQAGEEPKYVKVPYEISLGGSYFGLIKFLRRLEDSKRLVTVDSIKTNVGQGNYPMDVDIQFNIFYSKGGVETG